MCLTQTFENFWQGRLREAEAGFREAQVGRADQAQVLGREQGENLIKF